MIASQGNHQHGGTNNSKIARHNVDEAASLKGSGKCNNNLLDYSPQATAVSLFDDATGLIYSDSREHRQQQKLNGKLANEQAHDIFM